MLPDARHMGGEAAYFAGIRKSLPNRDAERAAVHFQFAVGSVLDQSLSSKEWPQQVQDVAIRFERAVLIELDLREHLRGGARRK